MFVVHVFAADLWAPETVEYWMDLGPAITAARMRFKKDERPRQVLSWPQLDVIWTTAHEPKFDVADAVREVFGGEKKPDPPYEGGPDGY